MITLAKYEDEKDIICELIKQFWIAHNDYTPTDEENIEDMLAWTGKGHVLYFIKKEETIIGFVHLASRGCEIDWIEDLFILPQYQGNGYGSDALKLVENIVKEYSDSVYLEVASRNARAMKLYYKNGYDCLNTVTIRKDFKPEEYVVTSVEEVLGHRLVVKDYKN